MSKLWRRLMFALRRGRFERDLEEEMRFHLEMKAQSGGGTEEARYAAQRRFGNTMLLRETSRELWGWGTVDRLWQDLRYAVRVLRKSPSFTLAAILTLSLGIGVNTSIFSLLHAFVLRQLPVRDPSTLALVFSTAPRDSQVMLCSHPDYIDLRDKNHVFSGLVAVHRQDPYLDGSGKKVLVDFVSENYFPVLAAGPVLHPELVAVVSDRFWKRHFDSDPSVAGKTLSLNGQRFMVIAVAPRDFGGLTLEPTDIWVPLATYPQVMGDREILGARQGHWLAVAGRLKPGATLQQAQAEMAVLARNLERQYPETNKGFGIVVSPASWVNPRTRNNVVPIVALLMGAVGLVLLIASANVANLLLARAVSRQREIGVRLSLGASRGRLIRQLLTESTLLSLAGGAVGLLVTTWIPKILFAAATRPDLRSYDFDFDAPLSAAVLTYSLILSLVTGVIFGLAPALQFTRPDLSSALKDGGAFGTKLSRSRLRNTLVAGQVAFSLMLLIVSGLFVRSVLRVNFIDPGFDPRGLLTLSFDPRSRNYSSAQTDEFHRKLLERAQLIPQVRSMSLVQSLPLGDSIRLDDFEIGGQQRELAFNIVSANYFRMLGVPALIGRSFEPIDKNGSPAVVMINESAARRFWPGQNPLGKRLHVKKSAAELEVIGVVRDFRDFHIASRPLPYVYIPATQAGSFSDSDAPMQLLVRTNGDVRAVAPALRGEAAALDRELHMTIQTIDQLVALSMWPARVSAALSGAIGLLALVLAVVGIYGAIAYLVSQRTREIGIRVALGAQRVEVVGLVLRQALGLVAVGVAVGLAGALAVSRVLGQMLYGLSTFDALTFVMVPAFLAAVAMLAAYIPARRAAKVDPMAALRYD